MQRHFSLQSFAVDDPFIDVLFDQEVRFEDLSWDDGGCGLPIDRQDFHGRSRGDSSGKGGLPWGEPCGREILRIVVRKQDMLSGRSGGEDDAAVVHDNEG